MDVHDIPTSLEQARTARGLTQQGLADAIGVTRQAVSHWENGVAAPGRPTRMALAQVLKFGLETIDDWFAREAVA